MSTIDLYTENYLGELSITLREKSYNQTILEVILLDFHFKEILSLIPLGQYHPESVMYNYFRCEGWYGGEWECKRKQEFSDQLIAISNSIPSDLQSVYDAIKQICLSAVSNNNNLFIELT
jgi:hypothetical protein